ncbi:probable N-acetyltransferase camello [Lingula anatina]|uniref:Probable N-acetyltransferase camello n=1 Tax=Lingula anatina TaxID=7574 RepID=A0A1S3HXK5_LINAN|nr:probable N-acetyltransferase camello [Lingula anatina]|eukprot:XP_013390743.1 probable N-acetyltransferase camello [Lingula anatina]
MQTTAKTNRKSVSIRPLKTDHIECELVWEMIVRNISNALLVQSIIKGMKQPIAIAVAFVTFALFYQTTGLFVLSGAVACVTLLGGGLLNGYYGINRIFAGSPASKRKLYTYFNMRVERQFWVAECDDKIIGCAGIQEASPTNGLDESPGTVAELRWMVVEAEYRRFGAASALLGNAIEFCKTRGYKELTLVTSEVQNNAICFYLKYGFEEIGQYTLDNLFPLFRLKMHKFRLYLQQST